MIGQIENLIGLFRKLGAWADLLDETISNEKAAVMDLAALAVHGDKSMRVSYEEGWHKILNRRCLSGRKIDGWAA